MKILSYISGFFFFSSLSFGLSQSASAITTNLSSANVLYSFGTSPSTVCTNAVSTSLDCAGTFAAGVTVPGITFGNFSANGVGVLGTDYGFERGFDYNANNSLGLAAKGLPNAFPSTTVRDINKYFGFTVTLAPGATLSISQFVFSVSASGTLADFSSFVGGTETALATGVATNGTYQTPTAYSFTPIAYNNPSTSANLDVDFRIYAYSLNNNNGYGIDSFSFTGSAVTVPFNFTPDLAVYALCGLYGANRLRNSLKKQKKSSVCNE